MSCKESSQTKSQEINEQQLSESIDSIYAKGDFAGFATVLVNDRGIVYQEGFGFSDIDKKTPYTANTLQPIASVSKTLIGIALLKAQEMGKLKLDDPVNKYLDFSVINPNYPDVPITIKHLATHTSGITDTEAYLERSWILENDKKVDTTGMDYPQKFNPLSAEIPMEDLLKRVLVKGDVWYDKAVYNSERPGDKYEYTNIGATLAALVVEKVTGMKYSDFTTQHILNPLGMNDSGWFIKDIDKAKLSVLYKNPDRALPPYHMITYPDGGFITSASDMGKYLTELIKGYSGTGTILSKESYRTLFTPQLEAGNYTERNTQNPYSDEYNSGIFFGISFKGYIGHTGGDAGVSSLLFFDPKKKTGRFMMINTNINDKAGNDAFYAIWDTLLK